jgi:hypothetical protein
MTFWVRVNGPEPKRKNRSGHADRDCYALNQHQGPIVEVPAEFAQAFAACSRCVLGGRWVATDEVQYGLRDWWAEQQDSEVGLEPRKQAA